MREDLTRHINRDVAPDAADLAETLRTEAIRAAVRPVLAREPGGLRGGVDRPHLTVVVQEVWLKLERGGPWKSRAEFLAAASRAARQFLIDEARRRKRRPRVQPLPDELSGGLPPAEAVEALALGDLLEELSTVDPAAARVASFKIFGGLATAVIAEVEGVSGRTVERHWHFARAWLADRIKRGA